MGRAQAFDPKHLDFVLSFASYQLCDPWPLSLRMFNFERRMTLRIDVESREKRKCYVDPLCPRAFCVPRTKAASGNSDEVLRDQGPSHARLVWVWDVLIA